MASNRFSARCHARCSYHECRRCCSGVLGTGHLHWRSDSGCCFKAVHSPSKKIGSKKIVCWQPTTAGALTTQRHSPGKRLVSSGSITLKLYRPAGYQRHGGSQLQRFPPCSTVWRLRVCRRLQEEGLSYELCQDPPRYP